MSIKKEKKLQHFYGDLHTHTGFSDGKGTPLEALRWAKESRQGDFLAISDHAGSVDQTKWEATLQAVEEVTDDTFVGLASFESGYSSEYLDEDGVEVVNGGELNVFGAESLLVEKGYPESYEAFCQLLSKQKDAVAFFNHPQEASWPTDKIWNAYEEFKMHYPHMKAQLVGVEVSNETSAYNDLHELVYTTALDKGWLFAPFATSDTHSGNWLSGFSDRTVVMAESLSREHILEAFRARRVYAVQNPHFQIEFEINGNQMGSILDPTVTDYEVMIQVTHKMPKEGECFKTLQLISDYGQVVAQKNVCTYEEVWHLSLQSEKARYYFVRVVNEAGQKIWTAPLWTGRESDTVQPVQKGRRIPAEQLAVVRTSSAKEGHEGFEIVNPDTKSWWEANGRSGELVIDLGEVKSITGIGYRKNYIDYEDRVALAKLLDHYQYAISLELEGEPSKVIGGRIRNYGQEHYEGFEPVKGRYVWIKALNAIQNGDVAIGNIYIYEPRE